MKQLNIAWIIAITDAQMSLVNSIPYSNAASYTKCKKSLFQWVYS